MFVYIIMDIVLKLPFSCFIEPLLENHGKRNDGRKMENFLQTNGHR